MLPPHLATIKKKLEEIPYAKRKSVQDGLLRELTALDSILDSDKELNEAINFSIGAQLTGPALGTCPSCGRAW